MQNKISKSDYSTRKTLENLMKIEWYSFKLTKKIQALSANENLFEANDTIYIKHIDLKEESESKTHTVIFLVKNDEWKEIELSMSWGIFLKTFIEQIESKIIAIKQIEKVKEKVKSDAEKVVEKSDKKWLVEKIINKMKWKNKK